MRWENICFRLNTPASVSDLSGHLFRDWFRAVARDVISPNAPLILAPSILLSVNPSALDFEYYFKQ